MKPLQGQKIVGCKWIFKKKERIAEVKVARFKSCLVVKGYSQMEDIDFNKVFFLIIKYSYICVLLAIVVLFDLGLEQLDFKIAFLHDNLKEHIYIQQFEGVVI